MLLFHMFFFYVDSNDLMDMIDIWQFFCRKIAYFLFQAVSIN